MSERYYITGAQLGYLKSKTKKKLKNEIIEEVIDKQFINNYQTVRELEKFETCIKIMQNKRGRKND